MTLETPVMRSAMKAVSAARAGTLWRNNCGLGLTLDGKRMIRFGVCNPGGSDLIGLRSVLITPDMVGKVVAVFAAVETKRAIGGQAEEDQRNFLTFVASAGGRAGIARSDADALAIMDGRKSWP